MGGLGSGGARKNAGRKSLDGEPRIKISVTLPAWQLEVVRAEAARQQHPVSNMITELITKGLER